MTETIFYYYIKMEDWEMPTSAAASTGIITGETH
jgi:hypothetical protein